MSTTTENHQTRLQHIETALQDLRDDFEYVSGRGNLVYALDFVEIHSYINPNADEAHKVATGVGIDSSEAARQHLLTLHHLFYSFSISRTSTPRKLYLLPPYLMELLAFAKNVTKRLPSASKTRSAANEMLGSLNKTQRKFLESLRVDKGLDDKQKSKLMEIVKGDFGSICAEVTRLVVLKEQSNRWSTLVENGVLGLDIDDFLIAQQLPRLPRPLSQELDEVLDAFDPDLLRWKYFQKKHDAEALTQLRFINRSLLEHNGKMLLITRDDSIFEAARKLHHELPGSTQPISAYLRRPESIYFDLILLGSNETEKIHWLTESIDHIRQLKHQVETLIRRWEVHVRDDFGKPEFLIHRQKLMTLVLNEAFKSWNERINLQLSNSTEKIPWISKIKVGTFGSDPESLGDAIDSVRHLFNFVESDEYSEIAIEEAKRVFADLILYPKRVQFLNELKEAISSLEQQFPLLDVGTVKDKDKGFLLPPVSSKLPFIEFNSSTYQKLFREFKTSINSHTNYSDALEPLMKEAVTGTGEPEDLLFMGFILCVLERWKSALSMMEYAATYYEDTKLDFDQVRFFTAFIQRRIARSGDNIYDKIEWLNRAHASIQKVMSTDPEDPRYLKEFAGITLEYFDLKLKLAILGETSEMRLLQDTIHNQNISLSAAKECLIKAWEVQSLCDNLPDDLRLRVEILNNLVFIEVVDAVPDFAEAFEWQAMMQREFDRLAMKQSRAAEALAINLSDTLLMLDARRAMENQDVDAIDLCLTKLGRTETKKGRLTLIREWKKEILKARPRKSVTRKRSAKQKK